MNAQRAMGSSQILSSAAFLATRAGALLISSVITLVVSTLLQSYAGISKCQQYVRQEVAGNQHDRAEHERSHNQIHVLCQYSFQSQSAQPWIGKHGFSEGRSAQ